MRIFDRVQAGDINDKVRMYDLWYVHILVKTR